MEKDKIIQPELNTKEAETNKTVVKKAKKNKKPPTAVIQVTQIRLLQTAQVHQTQIVAIILQNHIAINLPQRNHHLPTTPQTVTMMGMMMFTATANLIGTDTMKMTITQGALTILWMNMKNTEKIGKISDSSKYCLERISYSKKSNNCIR